MSSSKVRLKTTSSIDPNFCDGCGTMLPPIPALGDIVCLSCNKATPAEQFDGIESSYTIWFHKVCLIDKFLKALFVIRISFRTN